MSKIAEKAVVYAALILQDDNVEITVRMETYELNAVY
jgi:hypothetical protein